jgi:uncharacterized protein
VGLPGPTYDLGRVPLTLGYICLVVYVCKNRLVPRLMSTLACVGRVALTNYLMQSVICAFVFYGFGLGLHGKLQRHQLFYVAAAIWAVQITFSVLWLRSHAWGPAEWIWRQLSEWRQFPNTRTPSRRRHAGEPSAAASTR